MEVGGRKETISQGKMHKLVSRLVIFGIAILELASHIRLFLLKDKFIIYITYQVLFLAGFLCLIASLQLH